MVKLERFISTKIKASALHYTIVISIIISLLLAFLMLRLDLNHKLKSKLTNKELLLYTVQNDVLSKAHDSITKVNFWGAYPLIHSTKTNTKDTINESFMLDYQNSMDTINLYITHQDYNVYISGNSNIDGNVHVANGNITANYIGKESYSGTFPYVKGSINKSEKQIPSLHPNFKEKIQDLYFSNHSHFTNWSSSPDSIGSSFNKPSVNLFSETRIYIRNKTLKGHIQIHSSDKIEIDSKNTIQDILVTAPKVIIKKGFKGCLHIIAKEIIIEKNVLLRNPSSLIVISESNRTSKESIKIKEGSRIYGKIIFDKNSSSQEQKSPNVIVEENTIIAGNLYTKGTLEFRGLLYGQILTDQLYIKENGKVYLNHLYNLNIHPYIKNKTGLPLENALTKPLKWIY